MVFEINIYNYPWNIVFIIFDGSVSNLKFIKYKERTFGANEIVSLGLIPEIKLGY